MVILIYLIDEGYREKLMATTFNRQDFKMMLSTRITDYYLDTSSGL